MAATDSRIIKHSHAYFLQKKNLTIMTVTQTLTGCSVR